MIDSPIQTSTRPPRFFWWGVVLILLLAAALRGMDLLRFPVYFDEAVHIISAHEIAAGRLTAGLDENKWLYPFVVAQFNPTGPEGVWIARYISALMGVVTTAATFGLACRLSTPAAGLIAGLLYAILPLAIFHERQALVDPQAVAFAALSAVLVVGLAQERRLWLIPILSIVLAAAVITKLVVLPYLVLPLVGAVLLADWRNPRVSLRLIVLHLIATAGAVILILLIYRVALQGGIQPGEQFRPTLNNTMLADLTGATMRVRLRNDSLVAAQVLTRYFGLVSLALLGPACFYLMTGSRRRQFWFLFLGVLGSLTLLALIRLPQGAVRILPRYYLAAAPLLVTMIALSLHQLAAWLHDRFPALCRPAIVLLLAGITTQSLIFDGTLIASPQSARLADADANEYAIGFQGDPTRAAAYLLDQRIDGTRLHVIGYALETPILAALLGPREAEVTTFSEETAPRVARWLGRGDPIFLIGGLGVGGWQQARALPAGAVAEEAATLPLLGGDAVIYRITGAEGALADAAAAYSAPQPDEIAADVDALAASLQGSQPPDTILAYPSTYGETLGARGLPAEPLHIDQWPLDLDAARRALSQINTVDDAARIDVIRVDEARSDPRQAIPHSLKAYWLGEEWFGLIHRQMLLTGPAEPPLTVLNAVWEDAIRLVGAAIIDSQAQPGQPVRILLRWQTSAPVQDSYSVFVHLVDEADQLRAQHDGLPGGGLLPMTAWQPGEPIDDRFALTLPADLTPGTYRLRVGIYDPGSGLRLRVTEGNADSVDFVWAGQIEVR